MANSIGVVGDTLFTVSLAGSLFFNVSADAARPTVLLYLLLTLAPFAVVGPFVGTVIDRFPGSQRALFATTNLGHTVSDGPHRRAAHQPRVLSHSRSPCSC